jgi:H+/Cl- antiporter ClcA
MNRSTLQQYSFIPKLAALWIAVLVLPLAERTLLGAKTYWFLYIGLGLVFAMYGLTIRSIFHFLQHARREPVYVWFAFLFWSIFICSVLPSSLSSMTCSPTRQSRRLRRDGL